jgi:orotate phosphoribosyltransferase
MSDRDELLKHITTKAVVRGRVTLSSGREADWYVDMRRISLDGVAAPIVGRVMRDVLREVEYDAVGGPPLGAVPVVTAIMHAAAAEGRPIDAFLVRKEAKTHGLQRQIEGPGIRGRRVVVVDDTSTTGSSPLGVLDAIHAAGAEVAAVAVIVDRGARAAVEAAGLRYLAAFEMDELGVA